jgi:hypothetical protein
VYLKFVIKQRVNCSILVLLSVRFKYMSSITVLLLSVSIVNMFSDTLSSILACMDGGGESVGGIDGGGYFRGRGGGGGDRGGGKGDGGGYEAT